MISKVLESIRLERERQNITQSDMAERMDMSLTSYGNFERGKTKTTQDKIEKAAAILGKSLQSLVMGYDVSADFYGSLEEVRSRNDYFKTLLAEKDREISELKEKLATERRLVESKDDTIRLLKEIKNRYERQLPEKN